MYPDKSINTGTSYNRTVAVLAWPGLGSFAACENMRGGVLELGSCRGKAPERRKDTEELIE